MDDDHNADWKEWMHFNFRISPSGKCNARGAVMWVESVINKLLSRPARLSVYL